MGRLSFLPPALSQRLGAAVCAVCVVVGAGCAGVEGPRKASVSNGANVAVPDDRQFDSLRETLVLGDVAESIGSITRVGRVEGRELALVMAPGPGYFTALVENGDTVERGDMIGSFERELTDVEMLQREILELEVELANRVGDDEAILEAEAALTNFDSTLADRSVNVNAPADGQIVGARTGSDLLVGADRPLLSITDQNSVLVRVVSSNTDSVGTSTPFVVGDEVELVTAAEATQTGTVESVAEENGQVTAFITPGDPGGSIAIGDAVDVLRPQPADSGEADRWVPLAALHRSSGEPFLLEQRSDGSLRRIEIAVRQRTDTHVEIRLLDGGALSAETVLVLP